MTSPTPGRHYDGPEDMRMSTASSSYAAIGYLATQPSIYEAQRDSSRGSPRQQRRLTIIDFPTPSLNGEPSSPVRTSSRSHIRPQHHQLVHPAINDPELLSPYYQYARTQPAPLASSPQTYPQPTLEAAGGSQAEEHSPVRVPSPSSPTHPVHVRPFALPPPRTPVSPLLAAPPPNAFLPHQRSRADLHGPMIVEYPPLVRVQGPSPAPAGPAVTGGRATTHGRRPPIPEGYVELNPESDTDRQRRELLLRARERVGRRTGSGTNIPVWSRLSVVVREPRRLEDSEWLANMKKNRAWIKRGILVGLCLLVSIAVFSVFIWAGVKHFKPALDAAAARSKETA